MKGFDTEATRFSPGMLQKGHSVVMQWTEPDAIPGTTPARRETSQLQFNLKRPDLRLELRASGR
tara:strand:+ start:608 stop:799 length:192 start_codon:yes stop_codon:yes gene_type:complete